MFGLGQIVPAGHFSIGEHLADDVLKVGDHAAMRARAGAKEKPRQSGASFTGTGTVAASSPGLSSIGARQPGDVTDRPRARRKSGGRQLTLYLKVAICRAS